jgi:branched-chain amino acid transport system ATP-binding protein
VSTLETAEALLRVEDMSVGYGQTPVIRNLNLHVGAGEVVALLGPNGAGKSTILRALAGQLRPSLGTITLLGKASPDPLHVRARRGLAYVPEGRSVIASLSVRDNLRIGIGSVDAALQEFEQLEPLLGRRAGLLSGGEQQMLGLARALAGKPRVLLADELSLGLAPLVVHRLLETIRNVASERGLGALVVEQQVHSALTIADRVYVLRQGEIVMEGTPFELDVDAIEAAYMSS